VVHTGSLYFGDTLQILNHLTLNVSGRYNRTIVDNKDRINPAAGPGSLTSYNVFDRFNPSLGLTYSPTRLLGAYASYSESSRAPTSIELGCADPTQPCKLPNAFAGDPQLKQVVTRTWEAGLRGGQESRFGWSAGWFRAENRNDLLFVASEQTGFGYFKNFAKTLRQGAEVSVNSRLNRVTLGGGYTFLDATYQSAETLDGSSNSSNQEAQDGSPGMQGTIQIRPGNQIPLTPRHILKAYADIQVTSRLNIDLNELAVSKSFARGNENNSSLVSPPYYLGPGYSPGYALLNLGTRYRATRWAELFVQINNILNRQYYTGAQLGTTGFTAAGTFIARPFPPIGGEFPVQSATFYAPGAPIGVWGGIRFRF
jgi:outer membrane receptor protein involved in Fe transport